MKPSRFIHTLAALCLCGVTYAALAPALPWQEEMMPQVTEEHKMLMKGVGEFAGTITMHTMGPEPVAYPCSEKVVPVGELWTTSKFEMEFMGGQFSGASTVGYDPEKKKVIGTWVDSMTARLIVMEGNFDKEKDALVMHYDSVDPMSGETMKMRSENSMSDDGYHIKFFVVGETDLLQMEIEMKRK